MRFKIVFIASVLLFTASLGFFASAANDFRLDEAAGTMGFTESAKYSDIRTIVSLAVNVALSLLAIIFFGMMCYGGFRWLTAQGEDEKIEKAKTAIKAAIIGMVIVVSSYALTNFIFKSLSVTGVCADKADGVSCGDQKDYFCYQKSCESLCSIMGGTCLGAQSACVYGKSSLGKGGCSASTFCCADKTVGAQKIQGINFK